MKAKEFHKLLADPLLVQASHVDELKTLVKQYPYFQAAHILLARAAKLADDEQYDEILKKAALHSGDRKALFDLLMAEEIRRVVLQVDEEVEAMTSAEHHPETEIFTKVPEHSDVIITPDTSIAIKEADNTMEALEVVITSNESSEIESAPESESPEPEQTVIIEKPPVDHPEVETSLETEEMKALDREILFKAVYSSIEQEIQEDIAGQSAEEESQTVSKEKYSPGSFVNAEDEEDFASTPPAHSAFTAWLLQRAEETHFIEKRSASGKNESVEEDRKTKEKNLINDFIRKDPRIAPARLDQYSTENLGRSSIQESEALITETLAKVYVKQGKIDKAKKAYQLLSLKYPEKSIYFANQLKKLDEQT